MASILFQKVTAMIIKILQFLRMVDQANQLSITNLSVIGAIIAVIVSPTPYSIATLGATLVSYQWKRYHQGKADQLINDGDRARIEKLEADISILRSAIALKR